MPGKLRGFYLKQVLKPMINAAQAFPDHQRFVDQVGDDDWCDWDDYKRIVKDVAARLSRRSIVMIGTEIVLSSKEAFVSQGFDTLQKMLENWQDLFEANVHGAPPEDAPRTVRFEPGYVVIESSDAQPAALIEGYLFAAVRMFGGNVTDFKVRERRSDGSVGHRFELRWFEGPSSV